MADRTPASPNERLDRDSVQYIADVRSLLFHVNNVVHTRANLLLVAESIFFAALASLWKEGDSVIKLTIAGLGIFMTVVLWYANATLKTRSDALTAMLRQVDSIYAAYLKAGPKRLIVTSLLTHSLPLVSLIAWFIVVLRITVWK
jgi:hypothetical protein